MSPSTDISNEAGPSRSLRSRSPIKPTINSTRPIYTMSSNIASSSTTIIDTEPNGPRGSPSDDPASSQTAQSSQPLLASPIPSNRPKRAYSRRQSPSSLLNVPSRSSSPLSSPSKSPLKPLSRKGKGRAVAVPATVEKRVLPARIRRAAGTGAEGIRDLEEMIVDWLERWGEPVETPPDTLGLHLTTLPISLVEPALTISTPAQATGTIALKQEIAPQARERIEVPSWVFTRAEEDDKEEAENEIQSQNIQRMSGGNRGGGGGTSPVKRLRHATAEAPLEDTSDAYYIALHKKYEVFERRQRIREKETLQFERYKMRSRLDLLRGMSKTAWSAVVSVVLSRNASMPKVEGEERVDSWAKGRIKLEHEGMDWLRDTLVKEGEEVMKRYDELLPVEHRKPRTNDSPAPTITSYSPSLSPPPISSHRVTALRDPPRRRRAPSPVKVTPQRIRLTVKTPKSLPVEDKSTARKRKRTVEGGEERQTRSRHSLPSKSDEAVLRSESPSADEAPTPAPKPAIIRLKAPPISIRISRSTRTSEKMDMGQVGDSASLDEATEIREVEAAVL